MSADIEYDEPVTFSRAFEILGLNYGESNAAVREAFYKLALKYHPDKTAGSSNLRRFHQINAAYHLIIGDFDSEEAADAEEEAVFYRYDYKNDKSLGAMGAELSKDLVEWSMPDESDFVSYRDDEPTFWTPNVTDDANLENLTSGPFGVNIENFVTENFDNYDILTTIRRRPVVLPPVDPIESTLALDSPYIAADKLRILPEMVADILSSNQIMANRNERRNYYHYGSDHVSIEDIITDNEIAAHAPPYILVQKGNVTKIEVDCIILSTTPTLREMEGIDIDIRCKYSIISDQLRHYCEIERTNNPEYQNPLTWVQMPPATCVLTNNDNSIAAPYTIYAITDGQLNFTAAAYYNSLTMAATHGFRTIILYVTNISKRNDYRDQVGAVKIAIRTWIDRNPNTLDAILILAKTDQEYEIKSAIMSNI